MCNTILFRVLVLSWLSNSDVLAARSGAKLSGKIVEVIIRNARVQYERCLAAQSDIYRVDQERFKSQIAAVTLAEITWLYYPE
jgi:hypothetical protein